ncbi:hypothetical protein QCA50_002057 [Cerrena zonata]|uniref:FAM192A/Fyv6 N-terminal domain-containing protein n=1 Tax=Cerrena zonata TaxID=2478898 RepID=A0AAW0GYM2_9APHY
MEDIPSISSGSVGSRFVSQSDLETAKARRDEQWKAAYARLGQEPPPALEEEVFDGRSLAEKLAANRAAKQEEWEERNKLGNQFRALEEDEVLFLDSVLEKQREEERLREEMDGKELKNFRQAVAARENAAKPPPVNTTPAVSNSAPPVKSATPAAAPLAKKDTKKSLKGVIVKKKSKPTPASSTKSKSEQGKPQQPQPASTNTKDKEDADGPPKAKRRKLLESSPS